LSELADLHDTLALVAVGGVAGHEHQQRGGKKLNQSHDPEIECAAGQVIDLPTDGNRSDLAGEPRETSREKKEQKRAVPEQRTGIC
jgi:hypothetical protein